MKLTPNGPALPSIDREEADYAKMPQKILINFRVIYFNKIISYSQNEMCSINLNSSL